MAMAGHIRNLHWLWTLLQSVRESNKEPHPCCPATAETLARHLNSVNEASRGP